MKQVTHGAVHRIRRRRSNTNNNSNKNNKIISVWSKASGIFMQFCTYSATATAHRIASLFRSSVLFILRSQCRWSTSVAQSDPFLLIPQ